MKRILIMGGTGAMGVSLVDILKGNPEYEIYVTSRKHHDDVANVHYLLGDARNCEFLESVLKSGWDAIVDFMWYPFVEFREKCDMLLESAGQYIFLSSARVYAPSPEPITETSPRLLDVSRDGVFLRTDEYPLDKARSEDLLAGSGRTNWTVVRPYITFNYNRLQMGVLEKEYWLYRVLHGRSLLIHEDLLQYTTTMSCGYDVARLLAGLICNPAACSETFHIAPASAIEWRKVLEVYLDTICEITGRRPNVKILSDTAEWERVMGNHYQLVYDRLSDRRFDNSKIYGLCGKVIRGGEERSVEELLKECLHKFMESGAIYGNISWRVQGYMDRVAREKAHKNEFPNIKQRMMYLLWRYLPSGMLLKIRESVVKLKNMLRRAVGRHARNKK